jgi:hypothetical protein
LGEGQGRARGESSTTIAFRERPVIELLALDRDEDPDYAGYGWARVERVWLSSPRVNRRLDDALLIAVHHADDGGPLDLAFDDETVDLHAFLAEWLPKLPRATHAVLVMCNPGRVHLDLPLHHGIGDVRAWLDPGDRIRLTADAWRIVRPVTISPEDKQTYVGLYVLKMMDLKPEDGGMVFPGVLPSELAPFDEVLQQLAVDDYVTLNTKKNRWDLTQKGIDYLGRVIDEATELIDEFDEYELAETVAELRQRRLDPLRARFIWGWYDGEFDDLVHWQEQRGVKPVEKLWAFYLTSDDFYKELAAELGE